MRGIFSELRFQTGKNVIEVSFQILLTISIDFYPNFVSQFSDNFKMSPMSLTFRSQLGTLD